MIPIIERTPPETQTGEAPAFVLGGIADHSTPLVRNCWYVAALASEVSRNIISRRLLGIDVALYRTMAGEAVAVLNRCPHRSFPLGEGKACRRRAGVRLPRHAVRSVGTLRRNALDAHRADQRQRPQLSDGRARAVDLDLDGRRGPRRRGIGARHELARKGSDWKSVSGSYYTKSDYVAMHENLLDQTHFPFLHPGAIGTPEYARSKLRVRQEGDAGIIERELRNSAPPAVYGVPTGLTGKPVDRFSDARFVSPALHTAFARNVDNDDPSSAPRTYRFNITHIFTPETNHSNHY